MYLLRTENYIFIATPPEFETSIKSSIEGYEETHTVRQISNTKNSFAQSKSSIPFIQVLILMGTTSRQMIDLMTLVLILIQRPQMNSVYLESFKSEGKLEATVKRLFLIQHIVF